MSKLGEVRGVSRLCPRDRGPSEGAAEGRGENLRALARFSGQHADRPHREQVENPCRSTPFGAPRSTGGRQTIRAESAWGGVTTGYSETWRQNGWMRDTGKSGGGGQHSAPKHRRRAAPHDCR